MTKKSTWMQQILCSLTQTEIVLINAMTLVMCFIVALLLSLPGIEMEIVNSCEKNNGGCSHHCEHTTNGPLCSCNHGYRLEQDRKTCVGKRSLFQPLSLFPSLLFPCHSLFRLSASSFLWPSVETSPFPPCVVLR